MLHQDVDLQACPEGPWNWLLIGKYSKWVITTFWAALLMRFLSTASSSGRTVIETGEDGLVTPETIWCIRGTKVCLSMAVEYLKAGSVVHSCGTGDANQEISGPEKNFEMHCPGVKELIRSLLGEPGHISLSFPCDAGSWMLGPFLVSTAEGVSK